MVNAKTWNPAQIDQSIRRLEGIIRSGSYNPAVLNQILNQLGEPGYINTWNPAELDQKLRTLLHDLLSWKTATGNPIQLRTNNGGLVQSCEVTFSPIQSGSGDPSPTNIRQISGRDSVDVVVTGKNLCDVSAITQGSLNAQGQPTTSSSRIRTDYCKVLPNTTYTLSVESGFLIGVVKGYENTTDESVQNPSAFNEQIVNITTDSTVKYIRFVIRKQDGSNITPSELSQAQLELGSTATDYAPYVTPQTHTATFSDTVYGGVWKATEGKAVIDWVAVDLGDFDYVYDSTNQLFTKSTATITDILPPDTNNDIVSAISENYKAVSSNDMFVAESNNCFGVSTGKVFRIKDTRYTDATQFKTAMSGVKFCYELATPTEITLTPEEIELLSGYNVLWTDGDSIEITYKKLLLPSDVEELSKNKQIKEKPKTTRSKKKKEE